MYAACMCEQEGTVFLLTDQNVCGKIKVAHRCVHVIFLTLLGSRHLIMLSLYSLMLKKLYFKRQISILGQIKLSYS